MPGYFGSQSQNERGLDAFFPFLLYFLDFMLGHMLWELIN